ncbi:hypothetical protein IE53DRAFT_107606 [Violaceomyces palustris]|uniref:Uncharacterized protein n=1 Tax=Violaceomyces palustris TaxID=1673888 RepID=A0ACD0NWI8_9BASI|nr:hypothetical protein IE53DRAFT_107606 [Violaceomyces palustris]
MVSFTPALTDKHSIILADIFSKSSLHLQIPTQAESQSQRDIAFYDETLLVNLVLSLPVSNALPPPPDPSPSNLDLTTLVPLPIPPPSPSSPHPQVPLLLSALLSSLHVGLFADYVPSNPSSQAPNSFNPYTPLPTIPTSQIAYQRSTDASQQPGGQGSSDSVQCFSTSWEGNKVAPRNVEKREEEDQAGDFRGLISFQDQRWKVQWYCDLPVVFMNTSFARPLLSVTSSLTLRLAPKIMSHLFSTPVASQFSHSLLSPLHEGPIYPDESPTERLARSRASSALGLDGPNGLGSRLAELPNDVLGTKLVTPKFGEKALAEVEVRRNRALAAQVIVPSKPKAREEEVDLAGEDLGRIGLQVRPKGGKASRGGSDEEEEAKEREEEVVPTLQVLKRSVRKVLDVRSGLSVRMRTVYAVPPPNTQERYKRLAGDSLSLEADHGENGTEQDSDSNALVLCVELENGLHTGLDFLVEGVDIRVGGGQADDEESESEVSVKLLDQGDHQPFPLRLAQGDQRNLLYYVQLDPSLQWPRERPPAGFRRNFGIVVTGKPIILSPSKATSSADARDEAGVDLITPTASFPSRWNCNLDLTSLASARERRSRLSADEAPPEMNLNSSERALQNLGIAGSARHSALALEQAYLADRLSCGGNPNVEGNPNRRQPRLPTTTPFTEANQGPSTPVRTVSGQMGPSNASRNYPPSLSLSGMRRPSNWSTGPVRTPTSASVGLSATHGGFADRAISIYQPDTTTPQTPRTPTTWNGGMLSRARSRAASAAAAAATAAVSKDSFGEDHRNTGPLWEQASGGFDLESITDRRASLPRNRAESQVFSHHHHHQRLSGANGWGSRDLWPWSERHEGGASSGSRPDSTGFLHQQSRTEERYSQDTQQQQQQQQLLRYRQRSTVGTALGMLAISCRMIKDADSHHHGRPPLDRHRR